MGKLLLNRVLFPLLVQILVNLFVPKNQDGNFPSRIHLSMLSNSILPLLLPKVHFTPALFPFLLDDPQDYGKTIAFWATPSCQPSPCPPTTFPSCPPRQRIIS